MSACAPDLTLSTLPGNPAGPTPVAHAGAAPLPGPPWRRRDVPPPEQAAGAGRFSPEEEALCRRPWPKGGLGPPGDLSWAVEAFGPILDEDELAAYVDHGAVRLTETTTVPVGRRYGRLLVLGEVLVPHRGRGRGGAERGWKCRCGCGRELVVMPRFLRAGQKRCGTCSRRAQSGAANRARALLLPRARVLEIVRAAGLASGRARRARALRRAAA
jgi:hypothetical protein